MITSLQANPSFPSVVHQNCIFKSMPNPQPKAMSEQAGAVHISSPLPMTDEESVSTMADIESSLMTNTAEAMSLHGGLDLNRVMSLLDLD